MFPVSPEGLALLVEEIVPGISGRQGSSIAEELDTCEECGAALDSEGCPFCQVDI